MRSVHAGFAETLRWHLRPFLGTWPQAATFTINVTVQAEDEQLDPAPHSVFIDTFFYRKAVRMEGILDATKWDVWRLFHQVVRDHLLLHAGAVARDGRAVLLPARPESGKSSLTTALLLHGFDYLSDEFGAVDPVTGRLSPVERPISLSPHVLPRFPGLEDRLVDRAEPPVILGQRFVRPLDIGAEVAGPTEVGAVVFLTNDFDGPPRLTPIARSEAVHRMVEGALNVSYYRERAVLLLSRIMEHSSAYVLEGGAPAERADAIAQATG